MTNRLMALACAALILAPGARAEEARPAPVPSPWKITWEVGAEERVRSEALNNTFDFSDATDDHRLWYRFRTRAWAKATIGKTGEFYVGLNNESRNTVHPDTPYKWDEVVLENLYLDWKIDPSVSVRVGRQNLMKGEGFVLFDGTSGDGSRTAYFNAVDVTFGWKKSKVELIGISDPAKDWYLPVINDKNKLLQEWDEAAVGLYFTGRDLPKTAIDGYVFWKSEKDDRRGTTNAQFQPDRQLGILGGRVVQQLPEGFSLTAEAAGELGSEKPKPGAAGGNKNIAAWGGYAYAKKVFPGSWKPSIQAGWIGMSGDDPATRSNEGWDPLFSRWPKWSELYIYSQVPEKGVAYWTNLSMWQAELLASPAKFLSLRGTYYYMSALEAFPGSTRVFGKGKKRGDMLQARADVVFSKALKGHVLYEYLKPGDFYIGRDSAYFLRFELIYSFKKIF
jgi:hypothetical protein